MAKQRPLAIGEQRDILPTPASGLTKEQRDFATVTVQRFGSEPLLVLFFGGLCLELPGDLARDFGTRIARAMKTRVTPGARRGFRAGRGLTREQRAYVEVFMHDDFERTWLRLEFHDGHTVDFSVAVGRDFAGRVARAMLLIAPEEK